MSAVTEIPTDTGLTVGLAVTVTVPISFVTGSTTKFSTRVLEPSVGLDRLTSITMEVPIILPSFCGSGKEGKCTLAVIDQSTVAESQVIGDGSSSNLHVVTAKVTSSILPEVPLGQTDAGEGSSKTLKTTSKCKTVSVDVVDTKTITIILTSTSGTPPIMAEEL